MSSNPNIVIIVTAENKAGQVLQQVQGQVTKTQNEIITSSEKLAQSSEKVQRNYLQAGAAFAAVGASVVGFATSLDRLERAQLKAEIAQKRVNDLTKEGKQGTEEFRIAQEKLRLAQDNVSDSYSNFVASIGPQIFSTIFGLQAGFKALGITSVTQLIPAITGVGTAMKTAFLSPPPIGLIIAGIATVVILLATNAGGLRDAVVKLGQEIFSFIQQHLKPLADLLSWLNDNVVQPLARTLGITAVESTKEAENAFNGLGQETINLGHGIGTTADQLNENLIPALNPKLTDAAQKTTEALAGVEAVVARNIERFGAMGRTALQAAEEMTQASVKTVVGLGAIEQVLRRIQELQGQKDTRSQAEILGFRTNPLGGQRFSADTAASSVLQTSAGARAKIDAVNAQNLTIDQQIAQLTRMAQSLALATGQVSPFGLFGGGTTIGGLTFSPNFGQAATDFGTLISKLGSGQLRPNVDISVVDAILRGFTSNLDISGAIERLSGSLSPQARFSAFNSIFNPTGSTLTREQFFGLTRAQHGFEGILNKPTLFIAGEAGPEHVKITPGGKGTMKLVVQIIDANGNELGSSTLDDVNKEGVIRIKTRGVRLF